jgi:hypothetical protein
MYGIMKFPHVALQFPEIVCVSVSCVCMYGAFRNFKYKSLSVRTNFHFFKQVVQTLSKHSLPLPMYIHKHIRTYVHTHMVRMHGVLTPGHSTLCSCQTSQTSIQATYEATAATENPSI